MSTRRRLDELLESYTGIEVTRGGIDASVNAFVTRRCAELELSSLDDYLARLSPGSRELEVLLNAITVTHTWFMRDPGQLAVVFELLSRQAASAAVRVWVPGCATGEDVYSIVMLAERAGRSVEVLGTDINSAALERAALGVYGSWSVRELEEVERHFERGERSSFRILPRLKRGVRFERHNLLDPPQPGPWDIVLCRNVLIYLSRERARTVVQQLGSVLAPGGCLLLGASEVVFEVPPELEATYIAGRLALRRSGAARATRPSTRTAALPPKGAEHTWRAPLPALPQEAVSISARPSSEAPPPSSAEALLARGHALLDRSELPAAITEYELAVDAAPTHAEAHMYLGIALYLNGNLEGARHELRAAVFLDSKLWPAAFYLAVCHEARGEAAEALREYRHVVRVASAESATRAPDRHSAWHRDLLDLSRRRAGSPA